MLLLASELPELQNYCARDGRTLNPDSLSGQLGAHGLQHQSNSKVPPPARTPIDDKEHDGAPVWPSKQCSESSSTSIAASTPSPSPSEPLSTGAANEQGQHLSCL